MYDLVWTIWASDFRLLLRRFLALTYPHTTVFLFYFCYQYLLLLICIYESITRLEMSIIRMKHTQHSLFPI